MIKRLLLTNTPLLTNVYSDEVGVTKSILEKSHLPQQMVTKVEQT